ncbi:unnamed protein product [Colias eurytheme]|nr:unnamed protein product [Colias eurytheme]
MKKYEEISRTPKYEPANNPIPIQPTLKENSKDQNVKDKRGNNQVVPEDVVLKIAQTVKDLVLRELRKEFQTTTTTQKPEILSISRMETYRNEENIMEKFIQMFQSMTSQQKPSNPLSSDNKNSEVRIIKKTRVLFNPDVIINTQKPYDLQPQIHKHKSEKKPIPDAITFQTNSLEIPPLGIPITHRQFPINQNIIVTTIAPFKALQYDNGHIYSDGASVKVYPKEIIQSPLSAKFVKRSDDCPLHHNCNHKNEDIIRFRLEGHKGSAKYDTDYYEKINLGKPVVKKDQISAVLLPKFHEKLEKSDGLETFSDDDCCNTKYGMIPQMVDCCNQKIASRQQMSIANMKRGSYDDTHFRNFLKTQQKVTDMLEKILASRTKPELPRSVETT